MAKFPDHPLVVARTRAGLSQSELARRAGLSRLTVSKIENAATRTLERETAVRLEGALGRSLDDLLQHQINGWFAHLNPAHHLSAAQRSMLHLSPEGLAERFSSFRGWRQTIAPSVEFFTALIQVHRRTVEDYEKGIRVNGMPSTLAHGLLRLGISDEYLTMLRRLPPTEEG